MPNISWPIYSTIQYLTVNNHININNFFTILQSSPHLHTLIVSNIPVGRIENLSSTCFSQLTSLTIEDLRETIDELESFLLLTPSLVYLKLMGKQIATDVELIIALYQTSFWSEHKRWFVTCECDIPWKDTIHLYSIPVCKSSICYTPKSDKISLSTYPMITNDGLSIMDNIKSCTFTWDKSIADDIEEKKAISNCALFAKVTEIDIEFCKGWLLLPLQSLSVLIDITQIVCIKIRGYYFNQYNDNTWMDIGVLIVQNGFHLYHSDRTIENIYSNLPHHIKHLQTPIRIK